MNDVEIRAGRLDHQHVGAFVFIETRLAKCLTRVHVMHLIRATVAKRRRRLCRLAERTVERGRVLHGVREDGDVRVSGVIERRTNRRDLPVHHRTRRHDVGAGVGVRDRRASEERQASRRWQRRASTRPARPQWPCDVYSQRHTSAMTVTSPSRRLISAIARGTAPPASHAPLPVASFSSGIPNSSTDRTPSVAEVAKLGIESVNRCVAVAGHAGDRPLDADTFAHEQWVNELRSAERRLA